MQPSGEGGCEVLTRVDCEVLLKTVGWGGLGYLVDWAKDNKRVKWVGYVYNQVFGFGFK